jgi:hypothetical protein
LIVQHCLLDNVVPSENRPPEAGGEPFLRREGLASSEVPAQIPRAGTWDAKREQVLHELFIERLGFLCVCLNSVTLAHIHLLGSSTLEAIHVRCSRLLLHSDAKVRLLALCILSSVTTAMISSADEPSSTQR